MAQIGDRVEVTIHGGGRPGFDVSLGATTTSLGGAVTIAKGQTMTVKGTIVGEHADGWIVELDISISGRNQILLAKASQR